MLDSIYAIPSNFPQSLWNLVGFSDFTSKVEGTNKN